MHLEVLMSKKKKSFSLLAMLLLIIGIAASILAIAAPAADAIMLNYSVLNPLNGEVISTDSSALVTGFGFIFGETMSNEHITVNVSEPNTAAMVFYILFLVGALALILSLLIRFTKAKGVSRVLALVAGLALLVGGIGFFCLPEFLSQDIKDMVELLNTPVSSVSLGLGTGAILPAIGGLVGALTSFGAAILKK